MNKSTDKVDLIKQEIVGLEKVKQEQFGEGLHTFDRASFDRI